MEIFGSIQVYHEMNILATRPYKQNFLFKLPPLNVVFERRPVEEQSWDQNSLVSGISLIN